MQKVPDEIKAQACRVSHNDGEEQGRLVGIGQTQHQHSTFFEFAIVAIRLMCFGCEWPASKTWSFEGDLPEAVLSEASNYLHYDRIKDTLLLNIKSHSSVDTIV